jgi:hypothetical protein
LIVAFSPPTQLSVISTLTVCALGDAAETMAVLPVRT